MRTGKLSRRDILEGAGTLSATLFASPIKAAAPEPTATTPQLIEAARREGTVAYEMRWERWTSWHRGDPCWRVHAIDTTELSIDQVVEHIASWVRTDRQGDPSHCSL